MPDPVKRCKTCHKVLEDCGCTHFQGSYESIDPVKRECGCRVVESGHRHTVLCFADLADDDDYICGFDEYIVQHVGDCARTGELREALESFVEYFDKIGRDGLYCAACGKTAKVTSEAPFGFEIKHSAVCRVAEAKRVLGEK